MKNMQYSEQDLMYMPLILHLGPFLEGKRNGRKEKQSNVLRHRKVSYIQIKYFGICPQL